MNSGHTLVLLCRNYFESGEMACSRGQKILSLLQNTAHTSQGIYIQLLKANKKSNYENIILLGAARPDSCYKEQDKKKHIANITTEGNKKKVILNPFSNFSN